MFKELKERKKKREHVKALFLPLAADYINRFPILKHSAFYLDKEILYLSPDLEKDISKKTLRDIKFHGKDFYKTIKYMGWAAAVDNAICFKGTEFVSSCIGISSRDSIELIDDSTRLEPLEHEIGHILTEDGATGDENNKTESAADTFAAIANIKRYGKQSVSYHSSPYDMAEHIVRSPIHYTSTAYFAVKKLADTIDLNSISDAEHVEYAKVISEKTAMDTDKLESIKTQFLESSEREVLKEDLVAIMLKNKDNEDLYRVTKLWLEAVAPDYDKVIVPDSFIAEKLPEIMAHEKETNFILDPIKSLKENKNIDLIEEIQTEVKTRLAKPGL